MLVDNNVCYDVLGHGIILENGVETGNVISNNLVVGSRAAAGNLILSDRIMYDAYGDQDRIIPDSDGGGT